MEEETLTLIQKLSRDENFKARIFDKILDNIRICISEGAIQIGIQQYESRKDFKALNKACFLEDYEKLLSKLREDDIEEYKKILHNFDKIWSSEYSYTNEKCLGDIFLFPVVITFFDTEKKTFFIRSKHASFLLIDKINKKSFYIDSDDSFPSDTDAGFDEKDFKFYLQEKLQVWVNHLFHFRKKVQMLNMKAPQFFTDDLYCLFWSFYLAEQILKQYDGSKELQPKKIIQDIRKKYKTKQSLQTLIQKFIQKIIESE